MCLGLYLKSMPSLQAARSGFANVNTLSERLTGCFWFCFFACFLNSTAYIAKWRCGPLDIKYPEVVSSRVQTTASECYLHFGPALGTRGFLSCLPAPRHPSPKKKKYLRVARLRVEVCQNVLACNSKNLR